MMKRTHMSVALLVTSPLVLHDPITFIGISAAIIPDIDIVLGIKHRTLTHSILSLLFSTMIIYWILPTITIVWFISYTSHLLLDSCTIKGVPFLYPFINKYYGIKAIRTGSRIELIIQLILIYVIIQLFLNLK